MTRKRIFITRPIADEGIKLLKKKYTVDIYEHDRVIPRAELLRRLKAKPYDAVLTILTERVDEAFFKAAGPQLNVVANYAVGFNNIDLSAAKRHGVTIANTPGDEINESVAEHTIALLFALAHRIVEGDDYVRLGKYKGWDPSLLIGTDFVGKTVGVVGAGRIGIRVMQRLYDGFHIKLLYTNQTGNKEAEKRFGARRVGLKALLRQSDFVTLHVPLIPSTHHLIDSVQLKLMKKTAYLVNTSRGPVVSEKALTAALKARRIAGAGLDVFENEPIIPEILKQLPNVITTPHIASATIEARQAMSRTAAENIIAVLSGKKAPNGIV